MNLHIGLLTLGIYRFIINLIIPKRIENLKHGYYVLSEEEKKILRENSEKLEFIFKKIEAKGHRIFYNLRERVKCPKTGRLPQIEVHQLFIPTREAMNWAFYDTRTLAKAIEEVIGKDKIEQIKEELAFASLHRSFHEGKRILIFDRPFENDVTALKSQFAAGQTYKQNLWTGC